MNNRMNFGKAFKLGLLAILIIVVVANIQKEKTSVFIVGDSTVKNGSGKGGNGLWGWGDLIYEHFDTSKIHIENHARGGRSSRTFQTQGLWQNVLDRIKPGDYVLIQFGHNDGGAVNDTSRARGSIRGIGEEIEEIDNMLTKEHEIVHTYGWYMRKYITDTREKGGIPIVLSLVARNIWKDGKVTRSEDSYAGWAKEIAASEGAFFIDLNELTAQKYEEKGPEYVKKEYFKEDHTHTSLAGAKVNAVAVVEGLKSLRKCKLKKYLK